MTDPPSTDEQASDARILILLAAFGSRLDAEHGLITARMTWLMTINGFLIAVLGVTLANADKLSQETVFLILVSIGALGAIGNASCLFSNYWASRAITESGLALFGALRREGLGHRQSEVREVLRIYGRDPDAPVEPFSFWSPPSKVLHPWHLLPIVFGLGFVAVPFSLLNSAIAAGAGHVSRTTGIVLSCVPLVVVALIFGPLLGLEHRWRRTRRRERLDDVAGTFPPVEMWNEIAKKLTGMPRPRVAELPGLSKRQAKWIEHGWTPPERSWEQLHKKLHPTMDDNGNP